MAINWFEGGRRISKLVIGISLLGGVVFVFASGPAELTFVTEGPGEPWKVSSKECGYESASRYLNDIDLGGSQRVSATLCFTPLVGGEIPYAVAPTPRAAQEKYDASVSRLEAEDKARSARGDPPPLRVNPIPPKWYFTGSKFDEAVSTYIDKRRNTFFLMTPSLRREAREMQKSAQVRGWRKAADEALPVVAAIALFIWIFTVVMGWIVRGFAGISRGNDFRLQAAEKSRALGE